MAYRIITIASLRCDECGDEYDSDDCEPRAVADAQREISAEAADDGWYITDDEQLCEQCHHDICNA